MTDVLSPSIYAIEHQVLQRQRRQSTDFEDLLVRFPENRYAPEIVWALRLANAEAIVRNSSWVLGRYTMQELKEKNPEAYTAIAPVYAQFLKERLGDAV